MNQNHPRSEALTRHLEGEHMNWIPVKDEFPEHGVEVLIFSPIYGVLTAAKDWTQGHSPDHWNTSYNSRLEMDDVTHWMPLPKPPLVEH